MKKDVDLSNMSMNSVTIPIPLQPDMVLLRHCREDKFFLETMIVATIVIIVVTIKKIAKFGNFTG